MKLNDIKKQVTHFSLELKSKTTQEEEVIVGGKITNIVLPVSDEFPMYIVMLDDIIGSFNVYVPDSMMKAYHDQFKIGNYVFIEGFVNIISRFQNKKVVKDVSVFAYAMKDTTLIGEIVK